MEHLKGLNMKLNTNTIEILKNFATICPNIQFKAGNVLMTKSQANTIRGMATLDQTFPQDFAIYDLPRFISVLGLYKDPELTFQDSNVLIGEDNRSVKYVYTDPKMIVAVDYSRAINLPAEVTTFKITADQFSKVLKGAGVLGLPNITIQGSNGKTLVIAQDIKNPSTDTFEIEIGASTVDFKLTYQVDVLKLLPEDYTVTVYDTAVTKLECSKVTYYLAATITR